MTGTDPRPTALLAAAGLVFVAAAGLAMGAIPLAQGDPATDPRAVSPFWLIVGLDALAAVSILAGRLGGRDAGGLVAFGAVGALLLGLWTLDGAAALEAHGPSARAAVPILVACAVAGLTGAALALAALAPRGRSRAKPQH